MLWFRIAAATGQTAQTSRSPPRSPPVAGETDPEDFASDIDAYADYVYVIEAIYSKATVGRTRFYLIKWDGFNVPTWEPFWNNPRQTVAEFERDFVRFTWPNVTPPHRSSRQK